VIDITRRLGASPGAVWDVLVDTTVWPVWGPTVRAVELTGGGHLIGPGRTGRVGTVVGVWIPFEVTEWEEGRHWAWKVAGVPATSHTVRPEAGDVGASRATIGIPSWAPAYAAVVWIALGRIGRLAGA
jgi:hypothetical protein